MPLRRTRIALVGLLVVASSISATSTVVGDCVLDMRRVPSDQRLRDAIAAPSEIIRPVHPANATVTAVSEEATLKTEVQDSKRHVDAPTASTATVSCTKQLEKDPVAAPPVSTRTGSTTTISTETTMRATTTREAVHPSKNTAPASPLLGLAFVITTAVVLSTL